MVVVFSGFKPADSAALHELVNVLGGKVGEVFERSTTHVVTSDIKVRTLKVCRRVSCARARG